MVTWSGCETRGAITVEVNGPRWTDEIVGCEGSSIPGSFHPGLQRGTSG